MNTRHQPKGSGKGGQFAPKAGDVVNHPDGVLQLKEKHGEHWAALHVGSGKIVAVHESSITPIGKRHQRARRASLGRCAARPPIQVSRVDRK